MVTNRKISGGRRRKILLVNGPSQDPSDRFFGWPTPILYAVAPTAEAVRKGEINADIVPQIFDPVFFVKRENDRKRRSLSL